MSLLKIEKKQIDFSEFELNKNQRTIFNELQKLNSQ